MGPDSGIGLLPLAVGVAAARAIEEVSGTTVGLKWPNDLFLGSRKLGGILCESCTGGGREQLAVDGSDGSVAPGFGRMTVIAGIGINLRRPPGELPEELVERVSFLEEECRRSVSEPELAAALLRELRRWTDPLPRTFDGPLRSAWEPRDTLRGREVRVMDGTGKEGIARGIAPSGALLLERGGEVFEVRSGTIRPVNSKDS
jgi:BirA family biotin operon repressor/biotin-[acetyl-CoA-carboxylase] ligase